MTDPIVYIYRRAQFSYRDGAALEMPSNLCDCPCNTGECTGIDALFATDAPSLPTLKDDSTCQERIKVHNLSYQPLIQIAKMQKRPPPKIPNPCTVSSVRDACPVKCTPSINAKIKELMQAQTTDNPPCEVCTDIGRVLKLALDDQDFTRSFIGLNTFESLQDGADVYKRAKAEGDASIQQAIRTLEQKRAHFEAQAGKIRALKDKVRVATEVLHGATGKLRGMGTSFNTLEQQNGLQYKDRVSVGLPYLPPFFTLSNRNFVIMMVCINVLLLVGIIVYAFVGRIRTDADVVKTRNTDASAGKNEGHAETQPTTVPDVVVADSTPAPPAEPIVPVEETAPTSLDTNLSLSESESVEPEAAPSDVSNSESDSSNQDEGPLPPEPLAEPSTASTGRARGGRRRPSLSAGSRYAN